MYTYPEGMTQWRQRAEWLVRDFIAGPRSTKECLDDLLRFCNGDSCGTTVVHYCLADTGNGKPCCASDDESLGKLLSHAVAFYSRGYQTPLLYRMKHYGPASSFLKFSAAFFNILPQALALVHSEGSEAASSLADALLAETGFQSLEADALQALQDAVDVDENYAAKNKVRYQLVVQEIGKPSFLQGALLIDGLIQPIEHGVNYLLGHTALLHQLRYLGAGHPDVEDLRRKSKEKFLFVVQGSLADVLIGKFLDFLESGLREAIRFGLDPSPDLLRKVWQLTTVCITDIWRRFKHEFNSFPFKLFNFLKFQPDEFVRQWASVQERRSKCQQW